MIAGAASLLLSIVSMLGPMPGPMLGPAWAPSIVADVQAAQTQQPQPIRFDPARDLEGFEACFESEFRDLYPIEKYSALLAKEMKPDELADVQKHWKADLAEAESKLAKLRADPVEESAWLAEHRLAKSAYFSKITWSVDRSVPGFVILVQKLKPDPPGYAAKVAQRYGPWLQKVAQIFDATCVKPLGLKRRKGRAVPVLVILSTANQYELFYKVHPNYVSTARYACYDLRLGVAVGYDDPFNPAPSPHDQRAPILNAVVRGFIDEYASAESSRPDSLWVEEGIASYVADHEGETPDALDQRKLLPAEIKAMMDLARDAEKGPVLFHPIENLVELKSTEDVDKLVVRLFKGMRAQPPTVDVVRSAYYGQSTLWMHFLLGGKSGAYAPRTQAYLKSAFAGDGGLLALQRAFAGKDLATIDRDFLGWFAEQYRENGGAEAAGTGALDSLFDRHGRLEPSPSSTTGARPGATALAGSATAPAGSATAPAGSATAPAGSATAPAAGASVGSASFPAGKAGAPAAGKAEPAKSAPKLATSSAFSPSLLAPDPADVVSRHALALRKARAGDIDGAVAEMTDVSSGPVDPEEKPRVANELARLKELVKLRDGFFNYCKSTGTRWNLSIDGKKLPVKVENVAGGFVELSGPKAPEKLPLASIPPVEIASQAIEKDQRGDAAAWSRAYAYLLADDARWDKILKDDAPEAKALREDAKSWFPERMKAGAVVNAMTELSKKPLPSTPAEADAMLAAIKGVLATYGDTTLVKEKRPILHHLAEISASTVLEKSDLGALVRGKYTPAGEGRGKLVYDFTDPAQATDFVKTKEYLKPWREAQPNQVAPEDESDWTIKGGKFVGVGGACYRLPIVFSAPMTVKYRLRILEGPEKDAAIVSFGVGICDDMKENVILATGFGDLLVRDARGGGAILRLPTEFKSSLDTPYEFEVKHDGTMTHTTYDKKPGSEAPTPGLKSGDVLLWFHTNLPIAFERLEIEGQVSTVVSPEMKQAGIDRKLKEIGFK